MHREILVPVDGSDASRAALEHGVGIASDEGSTVHVVTVVEPSSNPLAFGVDEVEDINSAVEDLTGAIAAADGSADVTFRTEVLRGEPVYERLLEYADDVDADCIVLGRHGMSTLERVLLGSTADRVSRRATVPVVLVPGPEEE